MSKTAELLKEEYRRQIEQHLKAALDIAPAADLTAKELKELIDLLGDVRE